MTMAQDGDNVVSLMHRPHFAPSKYSWYSFLLDLNLCYIFIQSHGQAHNQQVQVGADAPGICKISHHSDQKWTPWRHHKANPRI